MGLLNAIRRYGLPDEGFAGYAVHRIRGAIPMSCALSTGDRASCDRNIIR